MVRYIDELPPGRLSGTALVRIDLNTADRWRLESSVPTLKFLMSCAGKIVVLSHRGRPETDEDHQLLSLRTDAELLSQYLDKNVMFLDARELAAVKRAITEAEPQSIFLLENVRFLAGEEENDDALARQFAGLGDYYVNEAFAVSHRANASVDAVTRHLPSYGGLWLRQEIRNLSLLLGAVERPFIVVIGGAKLDTKLSLINRFSDRADAILIGGALANALLEQSQQPNPSVILPVDFLGGDRRLDIGPKSAGLFVDRIRSAKTILWNGPVGMIEDARYKQGTETIARAIAANRAAYSVVGGGETVMSIRELGLAESFSFVSTGGGAMLEFLTGISLPGIVALERSGGSVA